MRQRLGRFLSSVSEPGHELWEGDDQEQADQLDGDKRQRATVDLGCLDVLRSNPSQIEEGEAEGRREERGL